MKRFSQIICLILVLSLTLAIPVSAMGSSSWASNYFGSHSCYLWGVSSTGFQVWFDVRALRMMDELGASTIKVQRSSDAVNWSTVKTYLKANYSQMTTTERTASYAGYVTFNDADSGYYYRAYVEYYAKDSNGTGTLSSYTSHVYIP